MAREQPGHRNNLDALLWDDRNRVCRDDGAERCREHQIAGPTVF